MKRIAFHHIGMNEITQTGRTSMTTTLQDTPADASAPASGPGLRVTDSAAARIAHLIATEPGAGAFRVSVNGGGCSGFQYEFGFAGAPGPDDAVIRQGAAVVLVDEVSAPFLEQAEIDWVDDLIGSSFKIRNPNARSSCGCGISFSV